MIRTNTRHSRAIKIAFLGSMGGKLVHYDHTGWEGGGLVGSGGSIHDYMITGSPLGLHPGRGGSQSKKVVVWVVFSVIM